jgi:hypothetical protein
MYVPPNYKQVMNDAQLHSLQFTLDELVLIKISVSESILKQQERIEFTEMFNKDFFCPEQPRADIMAFEKNRLELLKKLRDDLNNLYQDQYGIAPTV